MIRIKNKTGGIASVPSIAGAYDIADDGLTGDLVAVVDGVQLNLKGELDVSLDLRDRLRAGSWCAVDDDGNELAPAESLALFSPADDRTLDQRATVVESGSVAVEQNVPVVLRSWPISEDHRRSILFLSIDIDAPNDPWPLSALYSGQAKAGRLGALPATPFGRSVFMSTSNIRGSRIEVDTFGNDMRLLFRARLDATVDYTIRYTTEEIPAP